MSLEELEADARYSTERYRLYRAKVSGPHPTNPDRLRELQRESERAQGTLARARAIESDEPGERMQLTITQDQLIEAAQQLDQEEFTRADVAGQLGVDKPDLKQAFVHARKAGRLVKVRDDEDNTGHFRLI